MTCYGYSVEELIKRQAYSQPMEVPSLKFPFFQDPNDPQDINFRKIRATHCSHVSGKSTFTVLCAVLDRILRCVYRYGTYLGLSSRNGQPPFEVYAAVFDEPVGLDTQKVESRVVVILYSRETDTIYNAFLERDVGSNSF